MKIRSSSLPYPALSLAYLFLRIGVDATGKTVVERVHVASAPALAELLTGTGFWLEVPWARTSGRNYQEALDNMKARAVNEPRLAALLSQVDW